MWQITICGRTLNALKFAFAFSLKGIYVTTIFALQFYQLQRVKKNENSKTEKVILVIFCFNLYHLVSILDSVSLFGQDDLWGRYRNPSVLKKMKI